MNLIEQIKAEYMVQRKARATWQVASLSTLIGEIETLAKAGKGELTDAVVVTVVKKFIKNIDETIKALESSIPYGQGLLHFDTTSKILAARNEKKLYEQFMPKQLTADELQAVIDKCVENGMNTVGDVMKALKTDHGGQYDGAMASTLLKAKFTK